MSATKVKNNFGMVIDEVYAKGNKIVVEKAHKPVVIIVPAESIKTSKFKESPFVLSDKDYIKVKEGMNEFRKTFKFDF